MPRSVRPPPFLDPLPSSKNSIALRRALLPPNNCSGFCQKARYTRRSASLCTLFFRDRVLADPAEEADELPGAVFIGEHTLFRQRWLAPARTRPWRVERDLLREVLPVALGSATRFSRHGTNP